MYLFLFYFEIARSRQSLPNTWDLICYGTGTVAVLEGVRRSDGWPLLSVILLVIVYLFIGHWIPGFLGHHPIGFSEILELAFGMNGVFGIALAVVANIIALGVLVRLTRVVTEEAAEQAILARVPRGTEELNRDAFRLGLEVAQQEVATP